MIRFRFLLHPTQVLSLKRIFVINCQKPYLNCRPNHHLSNCLDAHVVKMAALEMHDQTVEVETVYVDTFIGLT